jgi:uncharacterized membrane protein YsdA (DUF1294 family)
MGRDDIWRLAGAALAALALIGGLFGSLAMLVYYSGRLMGKW